MKYKYSTGEIDSSYVKTVWKGLGKIDLFSNCGSPLDHYQSGLVRGTGSNFRSSVQTLIEATYPDAICNSDTAGNGAAMKCAPIAVAALRRNDLHPKMNLANDVFKTSFITHTNILGIAPAFSVAFLMYMYLKNDKDFVRSSPADQMSKIAYETKRFEDTYIAHLPTENRPRVNHYSDMLKALSKELKKLSSSSSPFQQADQLKNVIVKLASGLTRHPVKGPNSCFACASVTSAMVFGILFRGESFMKSIQYVIHQGEDTDTVATMVGSIIGASKGHQQQPKIKTDKPLDFSPEMVNQLIDYRGLSEIYRQFLRFVFGRQDPDVDRRTFVGMVISFEISVTRAILSVPPHERNPHYQKDSGKRYKIDRLVELLRKRLTEDGAYPHDGTTSKKDTERAREKLMEAVGENAHLACELSVEEVQEVIETLFRDMR